MIQDPRTKIQELARFARNPLITGSAVLFVGSMAGNVFHFLFNIFMSRNLSVVEYGILISLITITTFPGYLFQSITPTTINFATTFLANNNLDKLKGLYLKLTKILLLSGVGIALFITIFATQIADFLKIKDLETFVILLGLYIIIGLLQLINVAFLQARLLFKYVSFIVFLSGFFKFLFGIIFVLAGFRIGGALLAIILSGFVAYIIGFFPLRTMLNRSQASVKIPSKDLFGFGAPATLALIGLTSFINSDILLVKHFFSPQQAGLYAGLSLIGKVIFYFSSPIGAVMFPLVVKKHAGKQNLQKILLASIGLVLIPSFSISLIYFIFPDFIVSFFLKNKDYLSISGLVGIFAVYMSIYAILHLLTNFYLSIKRTSVYKPVLMGALLQIILISIYHHSLLQVILISITIIFLLVISLLLYYPHATRQKI